MAALKFALTRTTLFRVLVKVSLLAGMVAIAPLALEWADTSHPVRGTLTRLIVLLIAAFGGWALYWLLQRIRFRRGGPGLEPPPPQVREPRPPGGRPPALSAAARADEDRT